MRSRALMLAALALLAAACGSSSSGSSTASNRTGTTAPAAKATVTLSTRTLPGAGTVLVNGQGRTLYTFAPDKAKKVTCTGACAAVWPPLKISSGEAPAASGGARASLIGADPDPAGGRVVTYAGWPLYLYVADKGPGTHLGQALNSSGGVWYVISPSGTVVTKAVSGAGGGSSSSGYGSGGSGY